MLVLVLLEMAMASLLLLVQERAETLVQLERVAVAVEVARPLAVVVEELRVTTDNRA